MDENVLEMAVFYLVRSHWCIQVTDDRTVIDQLHLSAV